MSDNDSPYVIPINFGYEDNTVYFHSAKEGRKIDILKKNPEVCIEFDIDIELKQSEEACKWGISYKSVILFGTLSFVEDIEEKRKAFEIIMRQYSKEAFTFPDEALERTHIMKADIKEMTGKKS
jgi:nitroimidazol reductase NimA-like FMN-containing flavoprotein (pyridoxamine 5'-phosphate oxidase superfamily)